MIATSKQEGIINLPLTTWKIFENVASDLSPVDEVSSLAAYYEADWRTFGSFVMLMREAVDKNIINPA